MKHLLHIMLLFIALLPLSGLPACSTSDTPNDDVQNEIPDGDEEIETLESDLQNDVLDNDEDGEMEAESETLEAETEAEESNSEIAEEEEASELEADEQEGEAEEGFTTTPLDDYVTMPDDSFSCPLEPEKFIESASGTTSVFKMYSQTWRDESEVDRPLWWHWLTIFVPQNAHPSRAMLFIAGGRNREGEAPEPPSELSLVATMTDSIVAVIEQVPNERLKFADEDDERYTENGRTEDELIAYAWDKFFTSGDATWLPRLPMTKAAVRAMDVVQREHANIEEFVVVGASKRGWTTWTTGAVDDRVISIVPVVIDVLNVEESMKSHYEAYGFWAPATHDYVDMGIFNWLGTPEFERLREIVDPYSYLERYTMPKFILNSTGDQFFTPDSWKFYFEDLPAKKHLRYIPNTDHNLNTDAAFNFASFHHAVINETPLPDYHWQLEPDGNLTLTCESEPAKVTLWQAFNPDARDFRLETIGAAFESTELVEGEAAGVYRTAIQAPEQGWTAFLIEVEFPNPTFDIPFKFSTGVSILPDTFPYADTLSSE